MNNTTQPTPTLQRAWDAYQAALAAYRQKNRERMRHVLCDLCDAQDYGTPTRLREAGWHIGPREAFCWRH